MKGSIKFLSVAVIVTFALGLSACKNFTDTPNAGRFSKGLEFTLNEDRTSYSLTGIGTCRDTNIVIPATYNKLPVTTIAESVFAVQTTFATRGIQSLSFKNVEETTENELNSYEHINSVEIPEGVTTIESFAFADCVNLKSITIPETLISCGEDIFQNCHLLGFTRYEGVSYLGNQYNPYCWAYLADDQTEVKVHKNTIFVDGLAFAECYSLKNIEVEEENIKYKSVDGILYSKSGSVLVRYPGGRVDTDFTIPNTVTMVAKSAFDHCTSLENLVIPDTVTSMGEHAFFKCSELRSVVIGDGITRIEDGAFDTCDNLRSIVFGSNITSIGARAFLNCSSLLKIEIPEGITAIGEDAFDGCSKLIEVYNKSSLEIKRGSYSLANVLNIYTPNSGVCKLNEDENGFVTYTDGANKLLIEYAGNQRDITIPDGITELYNGLSFSGANITSVYIPDSVITIGERVFSGCVNLTSVIIPDSVITIKKSAFSGCENLRNIVIGNSVTTIEKNAFDGCSKLVEVYNKSNLKIEKGDYGLKYVLNIYTPNSGVSKLNEDENGFVTYTDGENKLLLAYVGNQTDVTIPNGITEIYKGVFSSGADIISLVIPDSVMTIGDSAFNGCDSLRSVVLGSSITTIGESTFANCSNLTSLVIPDSVITIGDSAFSDCYSLTSVVIGNGVTDIGKYAFYNCENLAILEIPDSVITIGEGAFSGCYGLTSIVIGKNVRDMQWAFIGCMNLTSVYYAGDIAGWCSINGLFSLMSNEVELYINNEKIAGELRIPNGVAIIHEAAFYHCNDLTSVFIPDSVTTIYGGAFLYCENLVSVTFESVEGWYLEMQTWISSSALENPETAAEYLTETYKGQIWTLAEEFRKDLRYTLSNDGTYYIVSNIGLYKGLDVIIPDTHKGLPVKEIGDEAFRDCYELQSVIIPNSVTSIGDYAFYNCSSLTSIEIPESVTSIGDYAFYNCSSLASIEIPESVTSIGKDAFVNCCFMYITVSENNANYKDIDGNLYTKDGTILLLYASGNSESSFIIPETVISISDYAFGYSKNLTSVVIGDSVMSIGNHAFEYCISLASVEFKNPNGWKVDDIALSSADLQNTAMATVYLMDTYCHNLWVRE